MIKIFLMVSQLMLFSLVSNAGYENTTWGMKLSKVKKLYPNGSKKVHPNGDISYTLVRSIALASETITMFKFSKEDKLQAVLLMFPESVSHSDLKKADYKELENEDAKELFLKLEKQLTIKYGEKTDLGDKNHFIWKPSEKDSIALMIEKTKLDDERSNVAIVYTEVPQNVDLSEGL